MEQNQRVKDSELSWTAECSQDESKVIPGVEMLAHAARGTLESFRVYLTATLHSMAPEELGQGSKHYHQFLGRKGYFKMRDRTLGAASWKLVLQVYTTVSMAGLVLISSYSVF